MTQVFISYSRKDLEFIDRLANDLKAAGFDIWYDLSGLEAGSRWGSEIQKAIQGSQFFLVVLSPNSIQSDWVEREFLFASEQGLKIIPLLYQPCRLPMWSLNLHFIDMQGRNYTLHFPELLKIMGVNPALEDENPIAIHYIKLGDEYRKRGQTNQAIDCYQQALQAAPEFLKARSNIGAIHLSEQAYSEASKAFEQVLLVSSEDLVAQAGWSDANMALGNQARAEGRIDEAASYYQEILRFVPRNEDALQSLVNIYISRAETLLNAGQEDDALIALSEAQKFALDDQNLASRLKKLQEGKRIRLVNEQLARAENEISTGKLDQAIIILNEALLAVPGDASLLKKLKDIEKQQLQQRLDAILSKVNEDEKTGHWESALAGLNEYLQLKPDDSAIQKRLADLMISKHAAWMDAINLRVEQALEKHNWDGALIALQEALSLEPENKALKARVARVQSDHRTAQLNAILLRTDQAADANRWNDAIDTIKTGLASFPDEGVLKSKLTEISQARQNAVHQSALRLADIAARAGKWETAVNSLNEVLATEPENVEFLQKLDQVLKLERDSKIQALKTDADNLLKTEKYDQAITLWNEALTLDPGNRQVILNEIEAVIQFQKLAGDYTEAKQAFTTKDYEKAVNLFKKILKEEAGYKDAAKLLEKSQKRMHLVGKTPHRIPRGIWLFGSLLAVLTLTIGGAVIWFEKNGLPAFMTDHTDTSTLTGMLTPTLSPTIPASPTTTPIPVQIESINIDPLVVKNGDKFTLEVNAIGEPQEIRVELSQLDTTKTNSVPLRNVSGTSSYTAEIPISYGNIALNGLKSLTINAESKEGLFNSVTTQIELKNPTPVLDLNPPNDNFDNDYLDWNKWKPESDGNGQMIQENGSLSLSIVSIDTTQIFYSTAALKSIYLFPGDFDIQVDFMGGKGWDLPPYSGHIDLAVLGVEISENMGEYPHTYHIGLMSNADLGNQFIYWNDLRVDYSTRKYIDPALSGKLRLIRSGANLISLYDIGAGWVELSNFPVSVLPARVKLQIHIPGARFVTATKSVTTSFDNFVVNSGKTDR